MSNLAWLMLPTAVAFGNGEWQGVLDAHRNDAGQVDYAAIHGQGAIDSYLSALASASEPAEGPNRIAFWINAYNALTVDLVADHFPIDSIRDLDSGEPWKTRSFTVAGQTRTLDDIEHHVLRPLGEPRIHFALNCAALSCPTLSGQAFDGVHLEAQLDRATRAWVPTRGIRIDRGQHRVQISKIFDWYAADFTSTAKAPIPGVDPRLQGALQFIANHLDEPDAQWIRAGGYTIGFSPYNWALNNTQR